MKRLVLAFALALGIAAPVAAAPPVTPAATISIDDATPDYGQSVTFTADANVSGTYIYMECDHSGGTSFSRSVNDYTGEPYSDDVGLYAPNWPTGAGATCIAEVRLVYKFHGKTTIDGASLTFTVAPA